MDDMGLRDVRPGFVVVGVVVRPFGIRGEVLVDILTHDLSHLSPGRTVYVGGEPRVIEGCRFHRGRAIIRLAGIEGRHQAEGLRSFYLEVPEGELAPLEEGEYYYYQLVGLEVCTTSGTKLGHVVEVMATGGDHQVLVVRGPRGEVLVPAVDEFVREVDLQRGLLVVEEVPGLLT
jgi:16S rRNA processing protein RimM